jgi:hypothetical protein
VFDWAPVIAEDSALGDGQVTDWVVDRLQENAPGPRFVAAGIYRPHLPWYVPPAYFDRYPLDEIELPPYRSDDLDDVPAAGAASTYDGVELHEWVV